MPKRGLGNYTYHGYTPKAGQNRQAHCAQQSLGGEALFFSQNKGITLPELAPERVTTVESGVNFIELPEFYLKKGSGCLTALFSRTIGRCDLEF